MSITKLMMDPKAAAIYASLDNHIHPATLADDYLQAKLAGDTSLMLALETHIRDLAVMHFERTEVREALSAMERHKARRKLGKSAPKMLQDIADRIERHYAAGAYTVADDGRLRFRIPTGPHAFLQVTCKDMPGAVALVAAKYRRGVRR